MPRNRFDFKEEKAINSLLFIASKIPKKEIHAIFKILYFADMKHLVKYGRPVVGDSFHALQYGPVPTKIYDDIKLVRDEDDSGFSEAGKKTRAKRRKELRSFFEVNAKNFVPKAEPDLDELSRSDIECLEQSIAENKDLQFGARKQKSHRFAYNSVSLNSEIPFENIAKEGGASEAMITYIRELNENGKFKP